MNLRLPSFRVLMSASLLALPLSPALAQSPNTSTLVVVVVDQTGAVMPGATALVANTTTGESREVTSGPQGDATVPGLSV